MKVALLTTYDTGGAGIACRRLSKALMQEGVECHLVMRKSSLTDSHIMAMESCGGFSALRAKCNFYLERLVIWANNRFSRHQLFSVSIANVGSDISRLKVIQEADVVHLHWVNQGFLSLHDIAQLAKLGKPLVWTLHDMWPIAAICHYAGDCQHYKVGCHHCPFLPHSGGPNDLSARVFSKKMEQLSPLPLHYVACSEWLASKARESALTANYTIQSIPNPIDTTLFSPQDVAQSRAKWQLPQEKQLILFGAMKVSDQRKGVTYLIEACQLLAKAHPEWSDRVGIVTFGEASDELRSALPFQFYPLRFVADEQEIASIYSAVDLFVIPSVEDNLPNTIMESLACGTPCVGFRVGGIPEMIVHRNSGYVADYKSSVDLAEGIRWSLQANSEGDLSRAARESVLARYNESHVAQQYIDLYTKIGEE